MMITAVSPVDFNAPNYAHVTMDKRPKKGISYLGAQEMTPTPLDTLRAYTIPFTGNFTQEVRKESTMSKDDKGNTYNIVSLNDFLQDAKTKAAMTGVIGEFNERKTQSGQFLKWVDLPGQQLNDLDRVLDQAETLKGRTKADGTPRPLVVLGIGGQKHTTEFMLNLHGVGNKGKVYFYSDIDEVSRRNFEKEVLGENGDIRDMNFLINSKSGTTPETRDGFERFRIALETAYMTKDGMNAEQAKKAAQQHFAIATDMTANFKTGNLRSKVGDKNDTSNDYLKDLYVHDDVGGRYNMFDDPGLFALAYAGVGKEDIAAMLKGAQASSDRMVKTDNLEKNEAAMSAMVNVGSRNKGYTTMMHQLFGHIFEGGGENFYKQLYLESLKDFDYMVGKAPDSMHYATEGQYTPGNRDKYHTVMTVMTGDEQALGVNYANYIKGISGTYNETTPLIIEKLPVNKTGTGVDPQAIGEYVQSKHFETVYMGMLRRAVSGQPTPPKTEALPEVLQPSVETYKNNFKPGAELELKYGK